MRAGIHRLRHEVSAPGIRSRKQAFRLSVAFFGIILLVYLVLRTGSHTIAEQAKAVGWGLIFVIALGGISHVIKTWAWRLTFLCDLRHISFRRTFGLRLISEAIGGFGLPGQVLGEAMRVSLLGSSVPVADSVSSVTLDRGLYIVTAAIVGVTGTLSALLMVSLSDSWRLYALLFASVLALVLLVSAMAIRNSWPVLSGPMRVFGRVPWVGSWVTGKQSVIDSAENNLLRFYHETPARFWASLSLNLACHALAVLEIYFLLLFMGARVSLFGAFVLEALTKLISVVGAFNPGNFGTFEGGNIILTKLFGISSAAGLTLGLCRRARALFWQVVGGVCLVVMSKSSERTKPDVRVGTLQSNRCSRVLPPLSCPQTVDRSPMAEDQSPRVAIDSKSKNEPRGTGGWSGARPSQSGRQFPFCRDSPMGAVRTFSVARGRDK
jgi:uncharacterized protein (TIRG00374 family)